MPRLRDGKTGGVMILLLNSKQTKMLQKALVEAASHFEWEHDFDNADLANKLLAELDLEVQDELQN